MPTDDKTFSVKPDPTPMPNALPPDTMNPTRRRVSFCITHESLKPLANCV